MFVPKVNDVNIKNNKIVFNDSVLPLKEEDSTLKLSIIENVSEYSLERCIKTIFEHNLDANFHTVQYSKQNEKIYFYADKILQKKQWYDIISTKHEPLNSAKEILQEIKNVLNLSINKNSDCISLSQISNLVLLYNQKFNDFEKNAEELIKAQIHKDYPDWKITTLYFSYPLFDNKKYEELHLIIQPYASKKYEFTFTKNNKSLILKENSNNLYNSDVLKLAGDTISDIYDKYLEFYNFKRRFSYNIKPINSNFYVNITDTYISLNDSKKSLDGSIAEILCDLDNIDEGKKYSYTTKSNDVVSISKNNEDELFKRIYVKIEDCPKWMQEELFCIRQNELTEERRINEIKKDIEENKSNEKVNIKRKLFKSKKRLN